MENNYEENIENSYILREYFKGFKLDSIELSKIKEKINKIDRNVILDSIAKQDSDIYNIIGENYSLTVDIFEKISDQINRLNQEMTNVYNDNLALFSIRSNTDENFQTEEGEREPASIKQLNSNIQENLNKIQHFRNEILAKNNIIDAKLNQIKEDENFLSEVEQEKELYIEAISEEVIQVLNENGFKHFYQFRLMKIVFEYVLKLNFLKSMNCDEGINDEDLFKNETIKKTFCEEFLKEISSENFQKFKDTIKESQKEFLVLTSEKLREVNKILESIKYQSESEAKDKVYERFFYPIFKSLKLIIFISLGRIRIYKLMENVENERDEIFTLNNKIKDLIQKNAVLDRLKLEINKKYDNLNSNRDNSANNSQNDEISNKNKIKQRETITKLKLLHNNLEHNYILLLKNLSKKILKPKDIIKKPDQAFFAKKIK